MPETLGQSARTLVCPMCQGQFPVARPVVAEEIIPEVIPVAVPPLPSPGQSARIPEEASVSANTWAQLDPKSTPVMPARRPAARRALPIHPLLLLGGAAAIVVFIGLLATAWKLSDNFLASYKRQNAPQRGARPEDPKRRADVVAALRDEKPLTDQELAEELRPLFDNLGKALRERNRAGIGAHFDANRMFDELLAQKVLPQAGPGTREAFARGVTVGLTASLEKQAPLLAWTEYEVRSIKKLGGNEAAVICRHRNLQGVTLKMRWWVVQRPEGWKVYDMEDLDMGVRISAAAAALSNMKLADIQDTSRRVNFLREALQALVAQDTDTAEQKLQQVGAAQLPPLMEGLRQVLTGVARSQRGQYQEALQAFDRAERSQPDMPALDQLRGIAYNGLGQWDKAFRHLQAYRNLLGDDPLVCCELGLALRGLQRFGEAQAAYRKSLDLEPNQPDALLGLLNSLAVGEPRGDLGPRFAKLQDPHVHFQTFADDCRPHRDGESMEQLALAMQKLDSEFAAAEYELALARVWTGRSHLAVQPFQAALTKEKDAQRRQDYVVGFCQEMVWAGKPHEAYAAVPDASLAFRHLAAALKKAHRQDDLWELTLRHGKKHPRDAYLHLYRAELHVRDEQYQQAEQQFVAALKQPFEEHVLADFRASRVAARYHTGQALSAYQDIGPRRETFAQLAELALQAENLPMLQMLLAAHAKQEPDSHDVLRYQWRLRIKQRQFPEAVAFFNQSQDKPADVKERAALLRDFLFHMLDAGEPLTAYRAAAEPLDAFAQLAEDLLDRENISELTKLLEVHRKNRPNDLQVWLYEAEMLLRDEDWEAALSVLTKGLRHAPAELRERFRSNYVYAMVKAGHGLLAYQEAAEEQRTGTFEQVANLLLMDKHSAELRKLLDARRPHAANDPDLLNREMQLCLLLKQYPEASGFLEQAYRRQTDDNRRRSYIANFVLTMHETGKTLEGYRAAPDAPAAFVPLARTLLHNKDERQLGALLGEYGKKHAATAVYRHYRGELHLLRGEVEPAVRELTAALALAPPQEQWGIRHTLLCARIKARETVAAYREAGANRGSFEEIANLCIREKNAVELETLLAAYRQAHPDDPRLPAWELELKWLQADYAGALKLLAEHRQGLFATSRYRWKHADYLVRALIKLKRPQEAVWEADAEAKKKYGNRLLLVLAHAAAGDVQQTQTALESLPEKRYMIVTCYQDADLGPILRSPPFAAVREKFPEPKEALD